MKHEPMHGEAPGTDDSFLARKILLLKVIQRMKRGQQLPAGPGLDGPIDMLHHDAFNPIRAGDVKPGEPARIYETSDGFAVNHALGVTMHNLDGSVVHMGLDGIIESTRPRFARIEIHDLRTVASYRINTVMRTTSHVIEFFGDGFFSFVMDEHGTIHESLEKGVVSTYDRGTGVLRLHGTRLPDDLEGTR